VSIQEIMALMRRHLAAVMLVIVATGAVAVVFKRAPVTYQESGTVVFSAPGSANFPNPFTSFNDSIIVAAGVMALSVMSPQEQRQIQAAGGTASYDAELVNTSDLEYPDYSDPYVTVTATGINPGRVHYTFGLVANQLYRDLAVRQAQANVSAVNRITAHMVGDTGLLPQRGSSKRVYAGLLVLAIIAAFAVAILLDRRPLRLNTRFRTGDALAARSADDRRASRLREQLGR
jgi:hypothetical protein